MALTPLETARGTVYSVKCNIRRIDALHKGKVFTILVVYAESDSLNNSYQWKSPFELVPTQFRNPMITVIKLSVGDVDGNFKQQLLYPSAIFNSRASKIKRSSTFYDSSLHQSVCDSKEICIEKARIV